MIRRFLLTAALIGAAHAQTLSLTGPAVAPASSTVTLTVTLASGGGPAGLQWDMTGLPAGATITSPVTGKTPSCNATRCVLTGVNTTAIPDGPIATITYTQPSTAVSASLAKTLAASPAGAALTVNPPTGPTTIPVQSNCDVNGDGVINSTDVGLVLQQTLASATGSPNIVDIIREIIASNGGACLR